MISRSQGSGIVIILFLLPIFLLGCDQIQGMFQTSLATSKSKVSEAPAQPQVQGTVLARINNDVITLESFDEKIKNLESLSPDIRIDTPDAKKGYLNDLIIQELIVQEAKARGIDKAKDIKDAVDEFKKGAMVRQVIMDETKGVMVQPSEIESFYNQYKKEFAAPEEIKVREIVVSSEATAKEVLISLLQGADFASVAKERSIAPSAGKGGDLGFVHLGDKFENFGKAVAVLDAGQVSPIFKGPDGFYIVKVEEKKGGAVPQLAEVYDQIKNGLLQQKQSERIKELSDKLKRDAKIDIKEDLLR
ncbi:MAG TPA: hypothetical protein DCL35_07975 [Candidatus Omnitrophica bacterium]|nr:hypothetical protein [Candidatus Omnitrophota bacterium]